MYIYLNVCKQMTDIKPFDYVQKKMSSGSFKNVINKMGLQITYI